MLCFIFKILKVCLWLAYLSTNFIGCMIHSMFLSIVSKIKHASNGISRICLTCHTERAVVAAEDKNLLLNKRQDLSNICPHIRRFYFKYLCLLMFLSISQHFHKQSQTLSLIVYVFDYVIYCVFCAVILFKFSSKYCV